MEKEALRLPAWWSFKSACENVPSTFSRALQECHAATCRAEQNITSHRGRVDFEWEIACGHCDISTSVKRSLSLRACLRGKDKRVLASRTLRAFLSRLPTRRRDKVCGHTTQHKRLWHGARSHHGDCHRSLFVPWHGPLPTNPGVTRDMRRGVPC
ncbi:hypothetical protein BC835DRAFT_894356 [Cytidiella melzeri]|nr:hypothetical protein BC835DRAFT_894356 [Cytidiella melzeri]